MFFNPYIFAADLRLGDQYTADKEPCIRPCPKDRNGDNVLSLPGQRSARRLEQRPPADARPRTRRTPKRKETCAERTRLRLRRKEGRKGIRNQNRKETNMKSRRNDVPCYPPRPNSPWAHLPACRNPCPSPRSQPTIFKRLESAHVKNRWNKGDHGHETTNSYLLL